MGRGQNKPRTDGVLVVLAAAFWLLLALLFVFF